LAKSFLNQMQSFARRVAYDAARPAYRCSAIGIFHQAVIGADVAVTGAPPKHPMQALRN
jgi:hypothetical protein